MRWCLLRLDDGGPDVVVTDMARTYARAAAVLGVEPDELNLEGACVVGDSMRWFHRGLPAAGSALGERRPGSRRGGGGGPGRRHRPGIARPVHYDLGSVDGVGLAVTDVVALPDGDLLACAAAEDSPNPRDDGPVAATALARIRGDRVVEVVRLPTLDGHVLKVEGLMVLDADDLTATLLAVIDVDDPDAASWSTTLRVRL